MEEVERPAPLEITAVKEIDQYDEYMTTNMLLADVVNSIKERFGVVVTEGNEEEGIKPTVSIRVVVLHPDSYGDLKEVEWMYKDLTDEADPDNAQED